jgi:hypothetical protein
MRNHVLVHWETWPLAEIDHLSVQGWITDLGARLAPATLVQGWRLMSGVMRSALRNRLVAFDPVEGVRIPTRRTQDTDEQIIDRAVFRSALLPVDDGVPVNTVQRVLGHERSSTTLDLYTRRTDDPVRVLQALDDDDPNDGAVGVVVPR